MSPSAGGYRLSRHAEEQMARRQIPRDWVDLVLAQPEQRLLLSDGREVLQSRHRTNDGTMFLLRLVVATDTRPQVVVTVYRTTKIEKYWRPE